MHLIGRTVAYLCCLTIFGFCEERSSLIEERSCDIGAVKFYQCNQNETCIEEGAVCRCRKDFERKEDGSCQPVPTEPMPTPASNNSSATDSGGFGLRLVLWLLLPVLLAVLVAGLVYTGRQKMWLSRFYRFRVRSYNNVLVGSQDEDDPPIA